MTALSIFTFVTICRFFRNTEIIEIHPTLSYNESRCTLRGTERQISDESVVVERIRTGNVDAFRQLFDAYSVQLLDFAFKYVRNPEIAEDVVQDIFVNVWTNRSRLNPSLSIRAYLYKAVLNGTFKIIRHEKVVSKSREDITAGHDNVKTPFENLHAHETRTAVQTAIQNLPEKCREVFILNRFDDMSYSEIAGLLDISVNTVKTQMSRAFKSIRAELTGFLSFLF